MTRKLMTVTALASAVAFAAGCSSTASTPSSTVGSAPVYQQPAQNESVQYGYVNNITQMETEKRTSGAGALLGAVVGGALGNQIGSGTGRAAATGVGAVGGAVIGNKIEERRGSAPESYYKIDVRLDNGEVRSYDYADLNGLRVGDRIRVENNQLQRW
ncbi:glycine zipper 2TM domain-containing protein [Piscinibacter sp.]|uniref:glycine zipper 2TM domain-containing protein n=1 Tax=Piscinibacter sp. TaxID=1903157 RepID=UPI002BA22DF9|nr:glycine zipper 2TM domain-containing protein [Albitalea sp.]HUG23943.1 glycine zipper 2TM domain-containing protein [Albitalea sp.]